MTPDKLPSEVIKYLESQYILLDDGVVEVNPEAGNFDLVNSDAKPGDVEYLNGIEYLIAVNDVEETPADQATDPT